MVKFVFDSVSMMFIMVYGVILWFFFWDGSVCVVGFGFYMGIFSVF